MFLSALEPYVVVILIVIVALQYAFALFCLLKLAYLDITKREYVLWNLFILLVFFIGDIAFLVYYYKKGKEKTIPPYVPPVEGDDEKDVEKSESYAEGEANAEAAETETVDTLTKPEEKTEIAENDQEANEPIAEEKKEETDSTADATLSEQDKPEKKAPAKKKPTGKKKTQ
ncbi:MAG: hypothetical protein J1G38_01665 [Clostridiales bacterium]|nr:hypothetical protein [Clostridiales bacterium]